MSDFCQAALAGKNLWINIGAGSSFLFWILTYGILIRRNYMLKTIAIPPLAICLNFSWEFLFTFVFPNHGDMTKTILYLIWFAVDLVLVWQMFLYGSWELTKGLLQTYYKIILALGILAGFSFQFLYTTYYGDHTGTELAYLINVVMSFEFLRMLMSDYGNPQQQQRASLAVAWGKFVGTLLSMPGVYFAFPCVEARAHGFTWLTLLFVLILSLDIFYISCIYWIRSTSNNSLRVHFVRNNTGP